MKKYNEIQNAQDTLNDVQGNIAYIADNARGIVRAIYELAKCDELINPDDMNGSTAQVLTVHELLRTHDTCARLVSVLSDTLDGIQKELDRLDGIRIPEKAQA